MTSFVLARKNQIPLRFSLGAGGIIDVFFRVNQKGIITSGSIAVILLSIVSYLALIYFVFGLGFDIQEGNEELLRLENAVTSKELKLHEMRADLAKNRKVLLSFMEGVTSVKYLVPESVAASAVMKHP